MINVFVLFERIESYGIVLRLIPTEFGGRLALPAHASFRVVTAAAISDDFYLRHQHVLKNIPKPPCLLPCVRSKLGLVHGPARANAAIETVS